MYAIIVYSDADQRKHQSSASLAFVLGIHRGPMNSPHKWPVARKIFPFDDVIMIWRHPVWISSQTLEKYNFAQRGTDYGISWRPHDMENWPFVRGIHPSSVDSLHKGPVTPVVMVSLISVKIYLPTVEQTIDLPEIWDVMVLMCQVYYWNRVKHVLFSKILIGQNQFYMLNGFHANSNIVFPHIFIGKNQFHIWNGKYYISLACCQIDLNSADVILVWTKFRHDKKCVNICLFMIFYFVCHLVTTAPILLSELKYIQVYKNTKKKNISFHQNWHNDKMSLSYSHFRN